MNRNKKCGLYLHIPFCHRKCLYCDFFSAGDKIADWDAYIKAILSEASVRREELPSSPSTLYIGGGTPSLIPTEHFLRLMQGLKEFFPGLSPDEFTIEANPDDIDEERINVWKAGGVNRVSLGVQSFNNDELKAVGRLHSATQAEDAILLLKEHFSNVSTDLIFGLPGQTIESWQKTVEKMIDLCPAHISAYSLMYEHGTPLTALRETGRLKATPEEDSERMFEFLTEKLRGAGYERYEISNYARPEMYSRHNTSYWKGIPYLGLGPSAHSYDGEKARRWNVPDLKGYIGHYATKDVETPIYKEEILTEEELREEYI
ncbi:MAG: radical SAM family heme chaperone HemW, partial [Muribaculaceae bacterium]|nr:radical SAM family heme chaperone HemW [Muribaculaceae bacterium]